MSHPLRKSLEPGHTIASFQVVHQIHRGGSSDLYLVKSAAHEQPLAMKLRSQATRNQTLENELSVLTRIQHCCYFPHLIEWGIAASDKYLVTELLGPSLATVRRAQTNQRYSISTALRLSLMMLQSLRALHCRGFVHCDVKPSNFLFRPDSENPLVLIDYGFAKSFINCQTGERCQKCQPAFFRGTPKYASINVQKGGEVGPGDDLISWVYATVELVEGCLPWEKERDFRKMRKRKARIMSRSLVRNLPGNWLEIVHYLQGLSFVANVNYEWLISQVTKAICGRNCGFGRPYDWELTDGRLRWGLPKGCEDLKTFPGLRNAAMRGKGRGRERGTCSVA